PDRVEHGRQADQGRGAARRDRHHLPVVSPGQIAWQLRSDPVVPLIELVGAGRASRPGRRRAGRRYRPNSGHRHLVLVEELSDAGQAPRATYHDGVLGHDPESGRALAPAARLHRYLLARTTWL